MANANTWYGQGGYLTNPKLSEDTFLYAQPMMPLRKYVKKLRVKGKVAGDTVNFPKFGNLDQEFATTPLIENSPMPESLQTVRQGQLTVDEWGRALPYTRPGSRSAIAKQVRGEAKR